MRRTNTGLATLGSFGKRTSIALTIAANSCRLGVRQCCFGSPSYFLRHDISPCLVARILKTVPFITWATTLVFSPNLDTALGPLILFFPLENRKLFLPHHVGWNSS